MKIYTRLMCATVFAAVVGLSMSAKALDKETSLYKFSTKFGGYRPGGELVMDKLGNLYGVTAFGGDGYGTVFELSPTSGGGWAYAVLYSFTGVGADYAPASPLVMDAAGNLYGATTGVVNGEIYELSPGASGTWTKTVLYPQLPGVQTSSVVFDAAGNLYGANFYGGANGAGLVFELSPSSGGEWTFRELYDFSVSDGFGPEGVTLDDSGNLYGVTAWGGDYDSCSLGCGVAFELTQSSGTWTQAALHEFQGSDGSGPLGTLTIGSAGVVYGIASAGGRYGYGTVFELEMRSGAWQEHILHGFKGATNGDGDGPDAGLVLYGNSLYGTTGSGGESTGCSGVGCGTAFELTPSGGGWKETILHDFSGYWDGKGPQGVIVDANGNLFGTASEGGTANNGGEVFELTRASK